MRTTAPVRVRARRICAALVHDDDAFAAATAAGAGERGASSPSVAGLWVLAGGDREDFGGVILPGYVVASITGQVRLSDTLQLNARIENLFDADYQTAADFRMQGRSAFVEIKYRRP